MTNISDPLKPVVQKVTVDGCYAIPKPAVRRFHQQGIAFSSTMNEMSERIRSTFGEGLTLSMFQDLSGLIPQMTQHIKLGTTYPDLVETRLVNVLQRMSEGEEYAASLLVERKGDLESACMSDLSTAIKSLPTYNATQQLAIKALMAFVRQDHAVVQGECRKILTYVQNGEFARHAVDFQETKGIWSDFNQRCRYTQREQSCGIER
ncbi:hypothetical protein AB6D11_19265 [Vibrio splendidus]